MISLQHFLPYCFEHYLFIDMKRDNPNTNIDINLKDLKRNSIKYILNTRHGEHYT